MKSPMKLFSSLACMSVFFIVGCTNDDAIVLNDSSLSRISFSGSCEDFENLDETKSYFDSDNKYCFSAGDAISVFGNGQNYQFVTSESGRDVDFSGSVEPAAGYYVLYPYQADATCSSVSGNVVITATIPTTQVATENSYDPSAHLSVSEIDSNLDFSLKHAVSRVKFVPKERFVKATFKGRLSNNIVAGKVNISVASTPVTEATSENNCYEVVLTSSEGFTPGKTYYITTIPQTFSDGTSLTLTRANGETVTVNTHAFTLPRNMNANFGNIGDASVPDYLKFTANEASTISLKKVKSPTDINISYSTDNLTSWHTWDWENQPISLAAGESVYFKGDNVNGFNSSTTSYYSFVMNGSLSASGDVMSLVYGESSNYSSDCLNIPSDYCFAYLFAGCKALNNAPTLSAVNLKPYCYSNMFMNSGITSVVLPATDLVSNCYKQMFYGCKSLNKIQTNLTNASYLKIANTSNWLMLANTSGNIYINITSGTYTANYSSIPRTWTIHGSGE